jgi:ribosomal protein S18 acetylase RimI-like enzyme
MWGLFLERFVGFRGRGIGEKLMKKGLAILKRQVAMLLVLMLTQKIVR